MISKGAQRINRLANLTELLSLTTAQQDEVKVIFDDQAGVTRHLIEQLKLKRVPDALASAEKTAVTDPDLDQFATSMANISSQILAADVNAQSKICAQLTAERQQTLEQLPRSFVVHSAP